MNLPLGPGLGILVLHGLLLLGTDEAAAERPVIPVTTVEMSSVLVYPVRDAPAETVSLNDTQLDAEITGVLADISVNVGDRVTKGEAVARLDCQHHRITVKRASAALESSRAAHDLNKLQLTNARKLSSKRNISQEELDKRTADARASEAELERLAAALEAAKLTAEKCAITAPFNGVVIEKIASIGEYAVPGTPVVRLLDDENIEISAKVQEQDLESLEDADDLQFKSQGIAYPVRLRTVLPLVDSRLKTYEVRLTFANAKSSPGATGRLSWALKVGRVPADLLVRRGERLGIFVLDGETARFVPIDRARPGHPASVELSNRTRILVDGRFKVEDADRVRVP